LFFFVDSGTRTPKACNNEVSFKVNSVGVGTGVGTGLQALAAV